MNQLYPYYEDYEATLIDRQIAAYERTCRYCEWCKTCPVQGEPGSKDCELRREE